MYGNLYSTNRHRREIEKAKAKIEEVRDILAGVMLDMLDEAEEYAEEHNQPFDDYVQIAGVGPDSVERERGIFYPENVAPDLDNAITSLDEAWESLYDMFPKPN